MNAKGGVGKSTLVLALAETFAAYHGKSVLVIDADAQASISHLLVRHDPLEAAQSGGRTIVDYLVGAVLKDAAPNWRDFVISDASDIDDARSVSLVPSDTQLTLFEREVSKGDHETRLRGTIESWLTEAAQTYDIVLIDSAPGLSVLTECFLREAHYYVSPTKPDYISTRGLKFLREFKQRDAEMGFAENLGVIINMKDPHAPEDDHVERWLREDPEHRCFQQVIPRAGPLQATGVVSPHPRSFWAKYPGETGDHLRRLAAEVLDRLATAQANALDGEQLPEAGMADQGKRNEGKMKAMWATWKERRTL
jgi:chromosome partitioning protein